MPVKWNTAILGVAAMLCLAGCSGSKPNPTDPGYTGMQGPNAGGDMPGGSVLGDSNLVFGTAKNRGSDNGGTGGGALGVNAYLWRGALDTLSFMPLASADPFGGVIITDWYTPPEATDERLKVNIVILGRELRADGVRATIFRQHRDGGGGWTDAAVAPDTGVELENAILTRARQLRIASAGQ